jgi:hypothetical protein
MTSVITCTCGKKFKVSEKIVGKKVRCPNCSNILDLTGCFETIENSSMQNSMEANILNNRKNSMKYEYKIDYIEANITDADVKKGVGGAKVTGQIEVKLGEWADQGYEFYRSEVIPLEVHKTGCFGNRTGESTRLRLLMFIFRKEIR